MHPASSIIVFTSASGIGFGLLFFLGTIFPAPKGAEAFVFFVIAYLLAIGGLISSTFHLGRPERALKAFKQWKTSWLSREAWLATGALFCMAIYGCGLVFYEVAVGFIGILGALLSLATVYSTSMIYAQLKAIPRWNTFLTPVLFLVISLSGGSMLVGLYEVALIFLTVTGVVQVICWIKGDGAFLKSGTNMKSAIGLGEKGTIRHFAPPHTGTNYLLNEFVYVVGRRHSLILRFSSLVMMIGIPVSILMVATNFWLCICAALFHLIGVVIARWLFFAQAEHLVGLYYGKR